MAFSVFEYRIEKNIEWTNCAWTGIVQGTKVPCSSSNADRTEKIYMNEKVNKSHDGSQSFFSTVVDGYVVYVTEYFLMKTPNGNPIQNVQGADGSWLIEKVGEIVDKFVLYQFQPEKILLEDAVRNEEHQRCRFRYPGCDKAYVQEKRRDNHSRPVSREKPTKSKR